MSDHHLQLQPGSKRERGQPRVPKFLFCSTLNLSCAQATAFASPLPSAILSSSLDPSWGKQKKETHKCSSVRTSLKILNYQRCFNQKYLVVHESCMLFVSLHDCHFRTRDLRKLFPPSTHFYQRLETVSKNGDQNKTVMYPQCYTFRQLVLELALTLNKGFFISFGMVTCILKKMTIRFSQMPAAITILLCCI